MKGYDEINDTLVEITDDEEEKAETRDEACGITSCVVFMRSQALQSTDQDLDSTVATYESLMDLSVSSMQDLKSLRLRERSLHR